jgi:hypothetical protein
MIKKSFLLIFLFLVSHVFAQENITSLIKKSGDAAKYPGENLLTVFDSTMVDVQESGLTYVLNHTLTKILTAKGAMEQNVIKFGYDPMSAFVEIRKAMIYRNDGTTDTLDVKKTADYPAPARAIYWGAREIMLEAGHLEPGDALEVVMFRKGFTYALLTGDEDDKYIPPMRGHFYDIVEFFNPSPYKIKVYQVAVPVDKTLQFEFYNGEAQTSSWVRGGKTVYTFTKKDFMPLRSEPKMVALSDVAPKLLLSTSPDWQAKSKWFFKVNEDFGSFDSTPEIKAKVDEILKGAQNEMDSVSRLTHWCADEIRYSGISMGEGEGFTLHKGSMTFTDRCGVCKDKAGMLITMLRAAGFKSYPAMTMAGSRIDYVPADQFNHCVTIVKLRDKKYHLLDPTWVPFVRELWSSAEQQQEYLMGLPEGADLASTPVSDPSNHYIKISDDAELQADGLLKGRITIMAEGQSDAAVRGLFKYSNQTMWFQNVERELLRLWPQAKVTALDYSDPSDYLGEPIRVTISYSIPQFAAAGSGFILMTPPAVAGIFKSFQGHLSFDTGLKERKYAFRDRCSRVVEISEAITLPAYKKIARIPESVSKKGENVSYEGGYRITGNTLYFKSKSTLGKRIYESREWPDFKSVVEAQNQFAERPLILEL